MLIIFNNYTLCCEMPQFTNNLRSGAVSNKIYYYDVLLLISALSIAVHHRRTGIPSSDTV